MSMACKIGSAVRPAPCRLWTATAEGCVHARQLQAGQLPSSGSVHDEAWLQQCCASLAEQLRTSQADNAELQVHPRLLL